MTLSVKKLRFAVTKLLHFVSKAITFFGVTIPLASDNQKMRFLPLYHKIEWAHFRTHYQKILVMAFNINDLNFLCLIFKKYSRSSFFALLFAFAVRSRLRISLMLQGS